LRSWENAGGVGGCACASVEILGHQESGQEQGGLAY